MIRRINWPWVNVIFWTALVLVGGYFKLTRGYSHIPDDAPYSDVREIQREEAEPLRGR